MKKCDPNARSRCPDGKSCELYAEFADGSWCDTFNGIALKEPMTNADRIRAMTDEELANVLTDYSNNSGWITEIGRQICYERIIEWLKQPAEVTP